MKHLRRDDAIYIAVSPPARGRGLKPLTTELTIKSTLVAPRTGAWIETKNLSRLGAAAMSPPARGRGLKQKQYSKF